MTVAGSVSSGASGRSLRGRLPPGTIAAARRSEEPDMPLLDHFNAPLKRTHPWRSFHGAWAAAMARLLNQGVLPPGYYAVPLVDRDSPIEIDVATLRDQGALMPAADMAWPQAWVAPAPVLAVAVDLPAV